MSKLAVRYNVSDVALAKVCRKLQVPIPPRGYWARVRHGQRITIPKLPKLSTGEAQEAMISPVLLRSRALPETVVRQKMFETDPAHRIVVDLNRELHPLVRKTRSILTGKLPHNDKEPPLALHVGKSSLARALYLLSTMLYAFEERGFTIEVRSGNGAGSFVLINEEPLQFSLREEAWAKDTGSNLNSHGQTGAVTKLAFHIHEFWASGYRKTWSDKAKLRLEDQLNDMMPALVELAEMVRKERLERDRRNAEIHEQIRQRELERARRQQIEFDLNSWRFAVDLRALISQVKSQAFLEEQQSAAMTRWLRWADWIASENDPLNKGIASFVERYKF